MVNGLSTINVILQWANLNSSRVWRLADSDMPARSSMQMRKLSRAGKGGTPDQAAAGVCEQDMESSYMKLPKPNVGRPAVDDLLASLCKQYAAEQSIGIIAAGMACAMLSLPAMCCNMRAACEPEPSHCCTCGSLC